MTLTATATVLWRDTALRLQCGRRGRLLELCLVYLAARPKSFVKGEEQQQHRHRQEHTEFGDRHHGAHHARSACRGQAQAPGLGSAVSPRRILTPSAPKKSIRAGSSAHSHLGQAPNVHGLARIFLRREESAALPLPWSEPKASPTHPSQRNPGSVTPPDAAFAVGDCYRPAFRPRVRRLPSEWAGGDPLRRSALCSRPAPSRICFVYDLPLCSSAAQSVQPELRAAPAGATRSRQITI
jgi:hypothetical protein